MTRRLRLAAAIAALALAVSACESGRAAGDGDVLMCHPSVRAVDGDAVGEARVQELSALALLGPSLQAAGSRVQLRPLSRTPFGQGTGRGAAVAAG